jgi:Fe-S cluster assembly protein SufD
MSQALSQSESFFQLLHQHHSLLSKSDPLFLLKEKAWNRLVERGLPSKKEEAYRYIKLRQLFSKNYLPQTPKKPILAPSPIPECSQSYITLVNGVYAPELSNTKGIPSKVVILPFQEAMRSYGTFLQNSWAKMLKEERDALALCNAALHPQGLFIYIPPKTVIETPIELIHITTHDQPFLSMPRINIFAAPQSELSLVSSHITLEGKEHFMNQVIEIAIEEDAHVHYAKTVCDEPVDSWHFESFRATLKRNASLKTVQMTQGSATVRHDYHVALLGENAEVFLNGLWMLDNESESHTHVFIDHQFPHCQSHQLFKGVLNGMSRSSFEGKIMVRQEAQKTLAYQMNPNLLLSERAHADSKPNLEIFADDVKASHGATVGQLDQDQLFYLRTRGLTESESTNLLVYGFCEEVITQFPESLKRMLSNRVRNSNVKTY